MSIRLWIDDVRKPPSDEWTWAKTLEEAMEHVTSPVTIREISFDHDLGQDGDGCAVTTQPVARWFEENAQNGNLLRMPVWFVHSMNPIGRKELYATMQRAERFIAERKPDGQA